jgi:hypothetical protein
MQAWGNYGTAWSVIHQQLGVRPFLNYGALYVVPQVPSGQGSVSGAYIRLGSGWVDVTASRSGARYTTTVDARQTPVSRLVIGTTLPAGSHPVRVLLDGHPARRYVVQRTNRGVEVTVSAQPHRRHVVVVWSA